LEYGALGVPDRVDAFLDLSDRCDCWRTIYYFDYAGLDYRAAEF